MEALLGGVLGGLARLAPEVLKLWDRRSERKHELDMSRHQLEVIKTHGSIRLEETVVSTESAQIVAGIDAIKEAYSSMKTGHWFADVLNATVRPIITYMIFGGWVVWKVSAYTLLASQGIDWATAVQSVWTPDDWTLLAGVTNFYFLGRVFDRRGG